MKKKIVKKLEGISKREYTAIMIMQGLASIHKDQCLPGKNVQTIDFARYQAGTAVMLADALLAELKKGEK